MSDLRRIEVACPDLATAEAIARTLVEERLAACATVTPGQRSCFRWEGVLQQTDEVGLHLKTRLARVDACLRRIAALHPDRIPGILVQVVEAPPSFAQWIRDETAR